MHRGVIKKPNRSFSPLGKLFLDMVPKETFWKRHAWLCVPSLGTAFSRWCKTGFGSCSISLDQGQVNCSLRLKIKLSSQTKNAKHFTKKRKWRFSYHEGFLVDLMSFLQWMSESLICIFVCMYTHICMCVGDHRKNCWKAPALQKGLFLCVDQQTIILKWGLFC